MLFLLALFGSSTMSQNANADVDPTCYEAKNSHTWDNGVAETGKICFPFDPKNLAVGEGVPVSGNLGDHLVRGTFVRLQDEAGTNCLHTREGPRACKTYRNLILTLPGAEYETPNYIALTFPDLSTGEAWGGFTLTLSE